MSHFSKEELSFANELPEHVEIECPVCLDILTDPHLVSCCGHNFCGSCIERVKASNGSCPMCNLKRRNIKQYLTRSVYVLSMDWRSTAVIRRKDVNGKEK